MSQVFRTTTYTLGSIIDPEVHNTEHDDFVNAVNDNDSRLTDIEQNAMTLHGDKIFSGSILFSGDYPQVSSGLGEPTDDNDLVRKASAVLKAGDSMTGILTLSGDPTAALEAATKQYVDNQPVSSYFKNPKRVSWDSAFQVKIPSGLVYRDDADSVFISFSQDEVVDITTATGAGVVNALMNGLSEANDTTYFVWAIAKEDGSDPKGLLSTSGTTITSMPTDYTKKRLLATVRNDSSGNFMKFRIEGDFYKYLDESVPEITTTAGSLNVLDAGSQTVDTIVSCNNLIPSDFSRRGYFRVGVQTSSASGSVVFKQNGNTNADLTVKVQAGNVVVFEQQTAWLDLDTSSDLEYQSSDGSIQAYLDVLGFQIRGGI
ncbi:MAG: hypothetical protein KTR14_08060 [Vampirovibrio sp.]|nr:hypothetical protein [Vampirovibrio sp.]